MAAYIIRRLLLLPVTLFGVTLFVFGVYSFLDPAMKAALYVHDIPKTSDALQRIIHKYGLDDPFYLQYGRWLNQIFHGNLGWSKTAQRPVLEALLYYFPATVELVLWAAIPVIFIGIWLGILSAVHHNKPIDHASRVFALIGWSFPSYVYGLLLIWCFTQCFTGSRREGFRLGDPGDQCWYFSRSNAHLYH
jgi:peptide/nickel transport system permease protein